MLYEHQTVEMFPDGRMNSANAARYLGYSQKTLAHMRCDGTGPLFIKAGRVFYYREDLDRWLAGHARRQSTAAGAVARHLEHQSCGAARGLS